uniref:CSON013009 protein n=3 Tax=Culicoides sonorensis TaxID=179676 RepID=A0A336LMT7_CULSO
MTFIEFRIIQIDSIQQFFLKAIGDNGKTSTITTFTKRNSDVLDPTIGCQGVQIDKNIRIYEIEGVSPSHIQYCDVSELNRFLTIEPPRKLIITWFWVIQREFFIYSILSARAKYSSNMKRENEDDPGNSQNEEDYQNGNQQQQQQDQVENEKQQSDQESQNNGNDRPSKRIRRDTDEEVRLLIPSKFAGAVIGKGGQNIQKLRNEYKATVNVGDCQGPERVVTIGGNLETCCNVIKDIMKHFDKGNVDEYELRILIHQSLAGCVIGKAGAKIKEIKDRIGCRLKIFSNICPQSTDRIAQVIGKEEQCIDTLCEIIELIRDTPIKGPVRNYDPHNYDEMYADEYGGYGGGPGNAYGGRSNDRNSGPRGNDRYGGGRDRYDDRRGGSGMRGGPGRGRDFVSPWDNSGPTGGFGNFGSSNNGFGGNSGFGVGPGSGNSDFGSLDNEGKTSTQVTIPKDLAGAIIGKGGFRIRRIRTKSNAFIQIDEALPGSSDRIITITGTPKQIQAAQYMLQQSVRENMNNP